MSVYIIAEIGCNHNGNIDLAYEMVDKAIECGVDAIKFQSFKADNLVTKDAKMANYAQNNMDSNISQYEMIKALELSFDQFEGLFKYIETKKIDWFSTPFDNESLEFLHNLGMNIWKVPSGDVTNLPFLEKVGSFQQKVIISTGMATIKELDDAINVLIAKGTTDITILHCITEYPAPAEEMNLNTIQFLKDKYPNISVGLSDHSLGYEAAIASVALGATMIEKHFTTDNSLPGPDHIASANPVVMDAMVKGVRKIEKMMGTIKVEPTESEIANIPIARKSIIAKSTIKKGELFTEENLTIKRPGNGISPMKWYEIVGTESNRDYNENELIKL